MKLPRNLTGAQFIKVLEKLGYQATRQAGSHVRLTCPLPKKHHLTVPYTTRCKSALWPPFFPTLRHIMA